MSAGDFHGRAFYSDKSQIAIRLLTREDVPVDRAFFTERLEQAAAYRERVVENTDAYRLVYSEADLLPSLIVDRYGDYLVMQTLSQSTERHKDLFVEILVELFSPKGILERNDPKVRLLEGLDQRVSVLHGEMPAEILRKGKWRHVRLRPGKGPEDRLVPRPARKSSGRAAICLGRGARLLQLSGRIRAHGRRPLRARRGHRHGYPRPSKLRDGTRS